MLIENFIFKSLTFVITWHQPLRRARSPCRQSRRCIQCRTWWWGGAAAKIRKKM